MANLAINALTEKTPVSTDLIPVADPTTGIAGKSTVSSVSLQATNVPITYSYTGTFAQLPEFQIVQPNPFQKQDGTVVGNQSPWLSNFTSNVFGNDGLDVTSFTFTNLIGITGLLGGGLPYGISSISFPQLKICTGQLAFSSSLSSTPNLASISLPVLEVCLGNFSIGTDTPVTTVDLPELYFSGGFAPASKFTTTINVPKLEKSGSFSPNGGSTSNLTTINAPLLKHVGTNGIGITAANGLTTINLPSLLTCGGNFNPNVCSSVATVNVPLLNTISGNLVPQALTSLTTLSFPSLTRVSGQIIPSTMTSLTTINLPAIERIGDRVTSGNVVQSTSGNGSVSVFSLSSALKQVGNGAGNWIMNSCALNQTSVDDILVRLAALDGTGGTTAFSNRTVTITGTSSTPSATGLAAKATLVARGCTVTNN